MNDTERQDLRDYLAINVMGWEVDSTKKFYCYEENSLQTYILRRNFTPDSPDAPASQIIGVIEAMRERGWACKILNNIFLNLKPRYVCEFFNGNGIRIGLEADTLPDAICLAAREALEGKR